MKHEKIYKSSSRKSATQEGSISQLALRPNNIQAKQNSQKPPTQEEIENEAFNRDKQEAFGLQLKEKYGAIAPEEQARLGLLQAKMDDFWVQRWEKRSHLGHNFANIPIHAPDKQVSAPIQPHLPSFQAKLTIGEPGDKYEQEADRVASQVVEQINTPSAAQSIQGQSVQRQEEPDEELQTKPSISVLQRSPLPTQVQLEAMPEDEELQAKSILQGRGAKGGGEASTDLESTINSARGNGQPLDAGLQKSMGQAMGADFSGVKVHTDAQADQLNQSVQAKAFTTGQDVFFRQGEYNPGSRGGQELIAHELTHVVQQNGGAVMRSPLSPEVQQKGRLEDSQSSTIAGEENPRTVFHVLKDEKNRDSRDIEVKERGRTVVSRMYEDVKGKIALPDSVEFTVLWEDRPVTPDPIVEAFVNSLSRPEWYKSEDGNVKKDTKLTLLQHYESRTTTDPFTGKEIRMWQCGSCKNGAQYEAIQIGHRIDWKMHLKRLGVKTPDEAKAAYNDLTNLQIECTTCNVGHAFERDSQGEFKE